MIHIWYQRIERHQIDIHEPHIRHQRMEKHRINIHDLYLVSTVGMMVTAWVGMTSNNNIAPTILN